VILVKKLLNWDIKVGLVVGSPVNLSKIFFFFIYLQEEMHELLLSFAEAGYCCET
jgi:hypothetical protein